MVDGVDKDKEDLQKLVKHLKEKLKIKEQQLDLFQEEIRLNKSNSS